MTDSKSQVKRKASLRGESPREATDEAMRDDHGPQARKELRGWPIESLRYELRYQKASGVHTYGRARCGHDRSRGSGFCEACLQKEIDRRASGE